MIYEDKASQVIGHLPPRAAQVDLVLIVTILKAVVAAYECFRNNKPKALKACQSPGILHRFFLHGLINRELGEDASLNETLALQHAIQAMGASVTMEDLESL